MRRGDNAIRSRLLVILLVAACAALAVGCGDEGSDLPAIDPEAERGTEPPGIDFFFDPAQYVGRQVTVTAHVSDVLTPVAFRIAGERYEGPGILVVSNDDLSTLDDDDIVQIAGTVRWFTIESFANDLGVRLDPVTFKGFEGGIAVAAKRITINGVRPCRTPTCVAPHGILGSE